MGVLDPTALHHVSFLASEAAVAGSFNALNIVQGIPAHTPTARAVFCYNKYVDTSIHPSLSELYEHPLKLQHILSSEIYTKRREELIKIGRHVAIRVYSSSEEGGALITTVPKHPEDSLPQPELMRERIEQRLGLNVSYIIPGECLCNTQFNKFVDPAGIHLLSQCVAGSERSITHNAVCDELIHMARAANLSAGREDRQIILDHNPNSKQRMDIVIDNFDNGAPLSIDFSIIDCRNEQYTTSWSAAMPGQAAKDREQYKIKKYGPKYAEQGYAFEPFVMESFGRFGARTAKLFDELAARVHTARSYMPLSYHKQFWRSRLVMALHRNAATGVKKRMANVMRRRDGLGDSYAAGNRCLPCDKVDMVGYGRCRG
jgi:hypothetical protein